MNTFPSMRSAVMAWAKPTTVFVTAKRQQDFKTVESYFEKRVNLFRVPTGQNIDMRKEGQRRWNTETVYADADLDLKIDDIIFFDRKDSEKFRVKTKTDWNQFGYVEYQVISDYHRVV